MTYVTSTLTSATCATDFLSALNTQMSGHFTTVESPASLGGTIGYVWKSDGTANHWNGTSGGYDWYILAYAASSGATTVYFGLCEYWDGTNKQAGRYVPYSYGAGAYTYDATNKYCTYNNQLLSNLAANTVMFGASVNIQTTQFTYEFAINHHRLLVGTRTSTPADFGLFIGMTENLIDTSISGCEGAGVSLCIINGMSTTRTLNYDVYRYRCGFTREPGITGTYAPAGSWGACFHQGYSYPFWSGADASDSVYKVAATMYVGQRVAVFSNRDPVALWQGRALLPNGILCSPRFSTAVNGDYLTISSTPYYKFHMGNAGGAAGANNLFVADVHTHA